MSIKTNTLPTMGSPKKILVLSQGDTVEVTVKHKNKTEMDEKKGQKRTSPIASSSSGQRIEKKSTPSSSKNWCNTFAMQNLSYLKQRQSSELNKNKEAKKNLNYKTQQKNGHSGVHHTRSISSKRISSQKKSEDNLKTSCCPSVLVQDRAVQCTEVYDNVKSAEFNSVHMLNSLMKELKDLVKNDKKSCEIFSKMEQALSKIPAGPEELLTEDLIIRLRNRKIQLQESSEQMKSMCESWMLEREKLLSRIQKQDLHVMEVNKKQTDLETEIKMLKEQLEVSRTGKAKDKTISTLKQQIENDELSERVISNLKTDLIKQTELARKNYINNQYLTMERDKWSELCCYKDTRIKEYQDTIKELQNQIANQSEILKELRVNVGSAHTIHIRRACSSPTTSYCSNESLPDVTNTSSIKDLPREYVIAQENTPARDTSHLELVSLLDEESSHTMPDSYQNQVLTVMNDKGPIISNNNNSIIQNLNAKGAIGKNSLYHSSEKERNKENDVHKARQFSSCKERQSDASKSLFRDASKILESITSNKLISDMKKQDNIQNRISVTVPSPVRDYPHPDWSDSSLPSISTASNLDVVSSNHDIP